MRWHVILAFKLFRWHVILAFELLHAFCCIPPSFNMPSLRCPLILFLITRLWGCVMSWEAPLFRGARLSESELDDVAKQALQMSQHEEPGRVPVINGCAACSKSYSEICPLTWELDEDDVCHAPFDYAGYCAHGLSFSRASVADKIVAEMSCSVCWPCTSAPSAAGVE